MIACSRCGAVGYVERPSDVDWFVLYETCPLDEIEPVDPRDEIGESGA